MKPFLKYLWTTKMLLVVFFSFDSNLILAEYKDSDSVSIQNKIKDYWVVVNQNPDSAYQMALEAKANSDSLQYTHGRFGSLLALANYFIQISDYDNSLNYSIEAFRLSKSLDSLAQALALISIANGYKGRYQYKMALKYMLNAKDIASNFNNDWIKAVCRSHLAEFYLKLNVLDTSYQYAHQAKRIFDSLNNDRSIWEVYYTLSDYFIETGNFDSTLYYLNKTESFLNRHNNIYGLAQVNMSRGIVAIRSKQFEKASHYFKKVYESDLISKNLKFSGGIHLIRTLRLQNMPDSANSLLVILKSDTSLTATQTGQLYFEKALLARGEKDFELGLKEMINAYLQSTKSKVDAQSKLLSDYEMVYELLDIENENQKLEEELLVKEKERESMIYQVLFYIALIIVLFLMTIFVLRKRVMFELKFKNDKITNQNSTLQKANSDLLKLNNEKNSAIKIVTHDMKAPLDRILGLVQLIKLEQKQEEQPDIEYLDKIEAVAGQGIDTIRNLIDLNRLSEYDLSNENQNTDINEVVSSVISSVMPSARVKNLEIESDVQCDSLINTDQYIVKRILYQYLNNAIKYSPRSNSIIVRAIMASNTLSIEVEDRGLGIEPHEQKLLFADYQRLTPRPTNGEVSTGTGLMLVREMAKKIKGQTYYKLAEPNGSIFGIRIKNFSK